MRPLPRHRLSLAFAARAALAVAFCLLFLLAAAQADQPPATAALHDRAEVGEGTITLAQLADITASDGLAETLAAVDIGPSPLPGRSRSITAGYVRMRIGRAGLDPQTIELTGATAVQVHRAGTPPVLDRPRTAPAAPGLPVPDGSHVRHGSSGPASDAAVTQAVSIPLLRRGERVQVVVISGAIVIQTTGRLMSDAVAGQPVMVQVPGTGQRLSGLLIGPRQVQIRL